MSNDNRTTVTTTISGPWCRHSHIQVDDNSRKVTCKNCGASLDPIACLKTIAAQQSEEQCRDQREDEFIKAVKQLLENGGTLAIRPSGVVASLDVRGQRQRSTSKMQYRVPAGFVECSLAAINSVRQRGARSVDELGPRRAEEKTG